MAGKKRIRELMDQQALEQTNDGNKTSRKKRKLRPETHSSEEPLSKKIKLAESASFGVNEDSDKENQGGKDEGKQ